MSISRSCGAGQWSLPMKDRTRVCSRCLMGSGQGTPARWRRSRFRCSFLAQMANIFCRLCLLNFMLPYLLGWLLVVGDLFLVIGCWLMVFSRWFLVFGSWFCWFLVVSFWFEDAGFWFYVIGCWLLRSTSYIFRFWVMVMFVLIVSFVSIRFFFFLIVQVAFALVTVGN